VKGGIFLWVFYRLVKTQNRTKDHKKVQEPNRKTTLSSTSIVPGMDVQEVRSSSAPGALVASDEGGLGFRVR
jgi:hypothetical protein